MDINKFTIGRMLGVIVFPFIILAIFFLSSTKTNATHVIMFYYMLYMNVIYCLWLWGLGFFLFSAIDFKSNVFYIASFFIGLASLLTYMIGVMLFLIKGDISLNATFEDIFNVLNLTSLFDYINYVFYISILYIYIFISKRLVQLEKNRKVFIKDYIGTFFLIYLLPLLNIYLIQSRIKKIQKG